MRLIFIRHAQTVANETGRWQGHRDYPLSATGAAQADALAHSLARERAEQPDEWVDPVVYSSSLGRALATAQAVGHALSLPVTARDALREYDVGVFSGHTAEELERAYPQVIATFRRDGHWDDVPQAEPVAARARRAETVINGLLDDHTDGQTIIGVTHGGFLQYLVAALLGTDRIWGFRPANTARFEFTLTAAARQECRDSPAGLSPYRCRINRFNDCSHLASVPR
jgi:broad specificity phosphatase PhoE